MGADGPVHLDGMEWEGRSLMAEREGSRWGKRRAAEWKGVAEAEREERPGKLEGGDGGDWGDRRRTLPKQCNGEKRRRGDLASRDLGN